jgi:hypothetical protein
MSEILETACSDCQQRERLIASLQRQVTHLKRDFQAMVHRDNAGSALGAELLLLSSRKLA